MRVKPCSSTNRAQYRIVYILLYVSSTLCKWLSANIILEKENLSLHCEINEIRFWVKFSWHWYKIIFGKFFSQKWPC